jgi:hypothetical protein
MSIAELEEVTAPTVLYGASASDVCLSLVRDALLVDGLLDRLLQLTVLVRLCTRPRTRAPRLSLRLTRLQGPAAASWYPHWPVCSLSARSKGE